MNIVWIPAEMLRDELRLQKWKMDKTIQEKRDQAEEG
jgi:hypothetical protein